MNNKNFWFKVSFFFLVSAFFLLYWSSNLLEKDVKDLKFQMTEINQVNSETLKSVKALFSIKTTPIKLEKNPSTCEYPFLFQEKSLLQEDPYIKRILPNLVGKDFLPSGVLHEPFLGKPDSFHPMNGFYSIVKLYDLCVPSIASSHVGKFEEFSPELALYVENLVTPTGKKEYRVHLRHDIFWQPLDLSLFPESLELAPKFATEQPVTAHDFKFFYDVVMNPHVSELKAVSLRSSFSDILEFNVIDDKTFSVVWESYPITNSEGVIEEKSQYTALFTTMGLQPLPSFVYQYQPSGEKIIDEQGDPDIYRKDSVWAQNFSKHWANNYIVSCGPFIFTGYTPKTIEFTRNPNYHNARNTLIEKKIFHIKDSPENCFQDFKTGKIDMILLPVTQKIELENFIKTNVYANQVRHGAAIKKIFSQGRSYFYIGWNCATPFFNSKKVRQALNMSIDKKRIIQQLNDTAVSITGPFALGSSSYNHNVLDYPFSPEEAEMLLEEEGWMDLDGDGIREKVINGERVPFRFKLYYFVKSSTKRNLVEYVSMCLKDVGIDCRPIGLDLSDLSRVFEEKDFDAITMGWQLGSPPEDPRSLWHSEGARKKGSPNAVGFMKEEVDGIIEHLQYEEDKEKRKYLYHRLHEIIHDEAPYLFLFSRKNIFLYRDYVKNIFIPKLKKDLIPYAEDEEINTSLAWIDKEK